MEENQPLLCLYKRYVPIINFRARRENQPFLVVCIEGLALDESQVLQKAERGERVGLRYAQVFGDDLNAAKVFIQLPLHLRCSGRTDRRIDVHAWVYI